MSEHDLIVILFVFLPLVFCGGVWLGLRIAYEQFRMDAEAQTGPVP